jgi:peptidyl-prolyl cis-trans isomerase SurA
MNDLRRLLLVRPSRRGAIALTIALATTWGAAQTARVRNGDYIVAVVNNELVTAVEVEQRLGRAADEARRSGARVSGAAELRGQVVDALIDERVLITYARDSGSKVDEVELDRAVASVAAQNQLTLAQLRQRLAAEGLEYARFRSNVRDQLLVERVREREVQARIRITDAEIERHIEQRREAASASAELNLAQILVPVAEGADEAAVAARRATAESALARVRGGEEFAKVVAELSQDGNRERGGEIGLRPIARLPDLFIEGARGLAAGEIAPAVIRSGAGFHVLKLIERREGAAFKAPQARARHILLRVSQQTTTEQAVRRLQEIKRQVEANERRFEDLARSFSEDNSAANGGDLGWASPGGFVPEFEEALNRLSAGEMSNPVVTRFGVHLIQLSDRREVTLEAKEIREQARIALREQKFEQAYLEWAKDLRLRAYVEMREPPL